MIESKVERRCFVQPNEYGRSRWYGKLIPLQIATFHSQNFSSSSQLKSENSHYLKQRLDHIATAWTTNYPSFNRDSCDFVERLRIGKRQTRQRIQQWYILERANIETDQRVSVSRVEQAGTGSLASRTKGD
ncbi:hypothetical protein CBL_02064 [Carabus blaptoides fortunei]